MKSYLLALSLAGFVGVAGAAAPAPAVPTKSPPASAHVYFNEAGTQLSAKPAADTLNCVQIDCPPNFKKGTVCWKCKKAPAAKK